MAQEQPKKRNCRICDTEHKVGEPCPDCGWHEEAEQAKVKGDIERQKMREEAQQKATPKKKGFFD